MTSAGALGTAVGRYRAVAAVPGLPALLLWGMIARLHLSATVITLVVVAADGTGSYGLAGLVSGALVLGQGVAGPLRGRAVDRRPVGRLLVLTSVGYGVGVVGLAALPAANWMLLAAMALAVGLILPPATQASRAKVAQLVDQAPQAAPPVRHTAYSVQSIAGELVAAVGPALAAAGIVAVGARAALALTGLLAMAGGIGLRTAIRRAGVAGPAACAERPDAAEREPGTGRPVALILAMTTVVAAYGVLSLALIGWGDGRGSAALGASVYALCSVGALAGGVVVGARGRGHASLAARLALVAVALGAVALVLPPLVTAPVWLVAVVGLASGTVAPAAVVAIHDRLAGAVPPRRRAETFGWMATATTAGSAMVAPVAGWLLDVSGPAAAVAASAALVLLVALITRP